MGNLKPIYFTTFAGILLIILLVLVSENAAQSFHRGVASQRLLNELFSSYDKNIRAFSNVTPIALGDSPTIVSVNLYVRQISDVDTINKDYTTQLTFRMQWTDTRLAFADLRDGDKFKYLTINDASKIWIPDLFFSNEIHSRIHSLLTPNMYIRIFPNGEVLYSVRITLQLECPMIFKLYPFDAQSCSMRMASYGYTTDDIIFKWKLQDPVQVTPNLHLPKLALTDFKTDYCDSQTNTGVYSCIRADFFFKRYISSYIVDIYIPCTMFVIISWLTLWLEHTGPGCVGRLLMSLTTLLVASMFIQQMNADRPPASYTIAVDIWTGICLKFIFSALVEFVIVNYLARHQIGCRNENNSIKPNARLIERLLNWRNYNLPAVIDVIARIGYAIGFICFASLYFTEYQEQDDY